jgi:hypothetical protein
MSPIYVKPEGFVARCKVLKPEQVRVLANDSSRELVNMSTIRHCVRQLTRFDAVGGRGAHFMGSFVWRVKCFCLAESLRKGGQDICSTMHPRSARTSHVNAWFSTAPTIAEMLAGMPEARK